MRLLSVRILDNALRILNELDRLGAPHAHEQRMRANSACLNLQLGRIAATAGHLAALSASALTDDERLDWLSLAAALPVA